MRDFNGKFALNRHGKIEMSKGGGCMGCFGLPFFVAGLFVLLIGVRIIPVSNANELPWWAWFVTAGMGLVFTAVGGGLIFGRSWVTLDKQAGKIWMAWGLLKPMKGTSYNLSDYVSVLLNFIAGDSDTADSFAVALKSRTGGELSLCGNPNFALAHEQAMLVSHYLELPLVDRSSDHHIITNPKEEPDITMQQHPEPEISTIVRDSNWRSEVQFSRGAVQIRIPGPRFSPYSLLEIVIPLAIAYFVGSRFLPFFTSSHTPLGVQFVFICFAVLFFVVLPVSSALKRYKLSHSYTTTLTADVDGLTLKQKGEVPKKGIFIARDNVIGLDFSTSESVIRLSTIDTTPYSKGRKLTNAPYPQVPNWLYRLQRFTKGKGVIIKSKSGIYALGAGLADAEIEYLFLLIKSHLYKTE
ncbi:MAG: hypothetical protein PHO32_08450 [Candidatus Cloacimonetes bacterium]|nr:hypothetical protein [Candidatus Cloacimonadota bacterium]